MLGEDVCYEVLCELLRSAGYDCQNKYGLLGKPINYNENGVKAIGEREVQ